MDDAEGIARGTDAELEAEGRIVATMIYSPETVAFGLDPQEFCCPFWGALYAHIVALALCGQLPDPVRLWERVKGHHDAGEWGLDGLVGMVIEAASPETFATDLAIVHMHRSRLIMTKTRGLLSDMGLSMTRETLH